MGVKLGLSHYGTTEAERVRKCSAEGYIWVCERGNNRRLEKITK